MTEDKNEPLCQDLEEETRDEKEDGTDERSSKKENSIFDEEYVKVVALKVTPSSSVASVLCEEKASLVTPPQSIGSIIFKKALSVLTSIMGRMEALAGSIIQEIIFFPSTGEKNKRLRALRVSLHGKK